MRRAVHGICEMLGANLPGLGLERRGHAFRGKTIRLIVDRNRMSVATVQILYTMHDASDHRVVDVHVPKKHVGEPENVMPADADCLEAQVKP